MSQRGSGFVQTPEREILVREDLDESCLFELDEFVNAYLNQFATDDPNKTGQLYLACVNPDGERRASKDKLCCWHPKEMALSYKVRLFSGDDFEDKYRHFVELQKTFRSRMYAWLLKQEAQIKRRLKEEDEMRQRQFDWEQKKLTEDC